MSDETHTKFEKVAIGSLVLSVAVAIAVGALFVTGGAIFDQSVESQITQECIDQEGQTVCSYTIEVTEFGGNDELYVFANEDYELTPDSPTQTIEGLSTRESLRVYSVSEQSGVDGVVYEEEVTYSVQQQTSDGENNEDDSAEDLSAPQYQFTKEANPDGSGANISVSAQEMNDAAQIIITSEGGSVNVSGDATVESNDFAEGGSIVRLYEPDAQMDLVGVPYNSTLTIEYVTEDGRQMDRDLVITESSTETSE